MADTVINHVKKSNFVNPSEDEENEFKENIDLFEINTEELPTEKTVRICCDVFTVLKDKICVEDFSKNDNTAFFMAKFLTSKLDDLIRASEIDENRQPMLELYLALLIESVSVGPRPAHVKLLDYIYEDCAGFGDYLKELSVEKWKIVIKCFKKDFTPLTEDESEEYFDQLKNLVEILFNGVRKPNDVVTALHEDYLDLYISLKLPSNTKPKKLIDVAEAITFSDGHPFNGIKTGAVYRHYLQIFSGVLCDPAFNSEHLPTMISLVEDLIKGLKEDRIFEDVYEDTMDFVTALWQKDGETDVSKPIELIGYYWRDVEKNTIKGKDNIFNVMASKLAVLLESSKDKPPCAAQFVGQAFYSILSNTTNKSQEHICLWIRLLKAALSVPGCSATLITAINNLEIGNKWKDFSTDAEHILKLFCLVKIHAEQDNDKQKEADDLHYFLYHFLDGIKKCKWFSKMMEPLVIYTLQIFEDKCEILFAVAEKAVEFMEDLNIKEHREVIFTALKKVSSMLSDIDDPDQEPDVLSSLTGHCVQAVSKGNNYTEEELDILVNLALSVFIPGEDEDEEVHHKIYISQFGKILKVLADNDRLKKEERLIRLFLKTFRHGDSAITDHAGFHIQTIGSKAAGVFTPFWNQVMDMFYRTEQNNLLSIVPTAYQANPKPMNSTFESLFEYVKTTDISIKYTVYQILVLVANNQPELFSSDNVKTILQVCKGGDPHVLNYLLTVIAPLAAKNPKIVEDHLDELLAITGDDNTFYSLYPLLVDTVMKSQKPLAEKVMNYFVVILIGDKNKAENVMVLGQVKRLTVAHQAVVQPHKQYLTDLGRGSSDADIKLETEAIVDILDGRSLVTVDNLIENQQGEIENLDNRVTSNETKIASVKEVVKQTNSDGKREKPQKKSSTCVIV